MKISNEKKNEEKEHLSGKVKRSFFDPITFKRVGGNRKTKHSPSNTFNSEVVVIGPAEEENDVENMGMLGVIQVQCLLLH